MNNLLQAAREGISAALCVLTTNELQQNNHVGTLFRYTANTNTTLCASSRQETQNSMQDAASVTQVSRRGEY
jgi:hypothetical protein